MRSITHSFVYHPDRTLHSEPSALGLKFDEVYVNDDVHTWWVKTAASERRGVLLHLHGNGGNISYCMQTIHHWASNGFDVVIFDYRGYGQSRGRASEKHTYEDARAVWDYIATKGVSASEVVVHGRSLGGGISSKLVTEVTPGAYIIESSFRSIPDIAKTIFPFIPAWMVAVKYDTVARIADVECPVLIAHSPDDEVVGYDHGRALFDAASDPKQFVELAGSHNEGWTKTATYEQEVNDFLTGVAGFP